ncbi:nitric oxide synthase oxygenase [Micromonospora purpureochromogenes]|uniref:nitric oxide synthase oxygenase n=1 Tax=Micromonospora purpureochromogenes TaxID=47872 RepID=UPI0034021F31
MPAHRAPVGAGAVVERAEDIAAEAAEFLELYHGERRQPGLAARLAEVREEIALTGSYRHTRDELVYGAKVAWRQSVRCVGRIRWAGLKVRDRRHVTTVAGIAQELAAHLAAGDNGGRIQSVVTVFAPDRPGVGPRARIWNDQLIRYCGHRRDDGSVLGDPAQVGMTEAARRLGWRPPPVPGRFDLLPWVIETAQEQPTVVEVPRELVREVALSHPEHPWFADLLLRWHALPVISNMRLRIGGVDYSCAPFNGHYLGDEIGTRNMGDPDRYDQLRVVAAGLGLDTSREDTLWREHAVLVINQAVLHSFKLAGVRVSDPHTESELFMKFCAQEERAGRPVHGDWSWLNGSVGWAALHAVHHRYYDTAVPNPNIWPADRVYDPSGVVKTTLRERHDTARAQED